MSNSGLHWSISSEPDTPAVERLIEGAYLALDFTPAEGA